MTTLTVREPMSLVGRPQNDAARAMPGCGI
jgi:hypothetical protein